MKRFMVLAVFLMHGQLCFAEKPSAESVSELLILTNTEMDYKQQVDAIINGWVNLLANMPRGHGLTDKPVERNDDAELVRRKVVSALKKEMAWESFKEVVIKGYQDNFSQDEVDGLIKFYKSPAGLALLNKILLVSDKGDEWISQKRGLVWDGLNAEIEEDMKRAFEDSVSKMVEKK